MRTSIPSKTPKTKKTVFQDCFFASTILPFLISVPILASAFIRLLSFSARDEIDQLVRQPTLLSRILPLNKN